MPCLICLRIKKISSSPYLIKELSVSYAVLEDYQYYRGYTIVLFKKHITDLHQLPQDEVTLFFQEMYQAGYAITQVFPETRLNLELLGNQVRHLHWHVIPRRLSDQLPNQPIWVVPKEQRRIRTMNLEQIQQLAQSLKKYL